MANALDLYEERRKKTATAGNNAVAVAQPKLVDGAQMVNAARNIAGRSATVQQRKAGLSSLDVAKKAIANQQKPTTAGIGFSTPQTLPPGPNYQKSKLERSVSSFLPRAATTGTVQTDGKYINRQLPYYTPAGTTSQTYKSQADALKDQIEEQKKTLRPYQATSSTMQAATLGQKAQANPHGISLPTGQAAAKPAAQEEQQKTLDNLKGELAQKQNAGYSADYSEQWRSVSRRADADEVKEKLARMATLRASLGTDYSQNVAAMSEYQKIRNDLEQRGVNAEGLSDWLRRNSDVWDAYEQQEQAQKYAEEHPIAASAKSIAQVFDAGSGTVAGLMQQGQNDRSGEYRPLNTYGEAFDTARERNAIRATAAQAAADAVYDLTGSEKLASAANFLYGTAMSGFDSAAVAAFGGVTGLGGAASIILGSNSAADTMMDVVERGGSTEQAVGAGVLAGVAESLFEKVSIEGLIDKFKTVGKPSFKSFVKNAVLQGVTEASEETATEIANILSDDMVMGSLSNINQMRAQGMSEAQIFGELSKQVGLAGLGGFLMGVAGGGVSSVINQKTLSLRETRALNALAEKLGVNLKIDEDIEGSNGYYDAETNTLHISRQANNATWVVAAHEATHALKTLNDADWQQLYEIANASLDEDARARLEYVLEETGYEASQMQEEVVAHYVQQCVTDIKSFEQLVGVNRTLAQKIVDVLDSIVRKMTLQRNVGNGAETYLLGEVIGDITPEQAQQTLEQMKKALATGGEATGEGTAQNSIKILPDGKRYVQADRQVIDPNSNMSAEQQVEAYIRDKIAQGGSIVIPTVDGDNITINADTAWKMSEPAYTERNRKQQMTESEYEVKANAAGHIDELVEVSKATRRDVPNTKDRSEKRVKAQDGWDYRRAYFEDADGKYYEIRFSVAKDNPTHLAYGMGKIKEASAQTKNSRSGSKARAEASNTYYAQTSENVKGENKNSRKLNPYALWEMADWKDSGLPYAPGYEPTTAPAAPTSLASQLAGQEISNNQAKAVLEDAASVAEMTEAGVDLSGTAAQRRAAVKEYVAGLEVQTDSTAAADGAQATAEETQQDAAQPTFGKNTVGAAETNPESYSHLQNEHGTVEPGENPARVVDMPKKDAQGQTTSRFARTAAESSSMPNSMVDEWQQAVASGEFSHEVMTDKDATDSAERKLEKGWNWAMDEWNHVVEGEKVADKKDIALGQLLLANAMKDGDTATAMRLCAELCAEATRAGQNIQATQLLKKMTPEGQLYYLQKVVNNLNEDFRNRKGFEKIEIDPELAQRLAQATTREQMDAAVNQIKQNIADQTPVTWYDKWNAWRYLAMLGNPTTQIRNVLGNALFYPVVKIKNAIATGIEAIWKKTGRLPNATKAILRNTESDKALKSFARNDFANVVDIIQGNGKYNDKDDIMGKRKIFSWKALEAYREGTGWAMDKGDELFSRGHYTASLAEYMKANGLTPETITPAQLAEARAYAIKEAQKGTYRDASIVASLANRAKRNLSQLANDKTKTFAERAAGRTGEILMEGFIPFTKTPVNIVKRGLEYSPAGLVQGVVNCVRSVATGKVDAATAIDQLASGLTGTVIMALGILFAKWGLISGGEGDDDRENRYKDMLGEQDYALDLGAMAHVLGSKVGVDIDADSLGTYTIDWLAPEALPFFVGVEVYNTMKNQDEGISLENILSAVSQIGDPMIELSMLSSINSAFDSIKYSQGSALSTLPMDMATSYLSQAVPTVGGKLSRTFDGTSRQTYYDPNKKGVIKAADVFRQKAQAKIPFAAALLPERVDLWGRTERNTGGNFVGRLFYNMLSPGYYSSKNGAEVDSELLRLAEATSDTNVFPSTADKTFKVSKETVRLNSQQYTTYAKNRGQTAFDILQEAMDSKLYKSMSDEEKAEFVKDVYEYATAKAKAEISEYTLKDRMLKIYKAEQQGISPVKYLGITGQYDVDNGGTVTQDEVKTVLNDSNLSAEQKAYMWKLQYKDSKVPRFK